MAEFGVGHHHKRRREAIMLKMQSLGKFFLFFGLYMQTEMLLKGFALKYLYNFFYYNLIWLSELNCREMFSNFAIFS